jgi:tetratricopeptide (TPR) repeat protein
MPFSYSSKPLFSIKRLVIISFFLGLAACGIAPVSETQSSDSAVAADVSAEEALMKDGFDALMNFDPRAAISYFDAVIVQCDRRYRNSSQRVYASRSLIETLYYMSLAGESKTDAIAVDSLCSQALYLKAYATIEMEDVDGAAELLEQAIALSPANATYLSELGHVYHMKGNWQKSLVLFQEAEDFAERFSPPDVQLSELTRAKRGVAYSLIEMGDLAGAEKKFNECLTLDPKDDISRGELEYIRRLRAGELVD